MVLSIMWVIGLPIKEMIAYEDVITESFKSCLTWFSSTYQYCEDRTGRMRRGNVDMTLKELLFLVDSPRDSGAAWVKFLGPVVLLWLGGGIVIWVIRGFTKQQGRGIR